MQHWHLLERIFTVETIMTPFDSLLVWDGSNESLEAVRHEARAHKIDTIPVLEGGRVSSVLLLEDDHPIPLTQDWLITCNASILKVVRAFAQANKAVYLC